MTVNEVSFMVNKSVSGGRFEGFAVVFEYFLAIQHSHLFVVRCWLRPLIRYKASGRIPITQQDSTVLILELLWESEGPKDFHFLILSVRRCEVKQPTPCPIPDKLNLFAPNVRLCGSVLLHLGPRLARGWAGFQRVWLSNRVCNKHPHIITSRNYMSPPRSTRSS
jgi:hypothetical protein